MNVTQDILLPVLLAALLANTAIILFLAVTTSYRRRARTRVATMGSPLGLERAMLSGSHDHRERDGWPAPIATVPLARVDGESAVAPAGAPGWDADPDDRESDAEPDGPEPHGLLTRDLVGESRDTAGEPADGPGLTGLVGNGSAAVQLPAFLDVSASDAPRNGRDTLTGLLDQAAWGRILGEEDARVRRYHRPATVVLFELEGLDRLVERLGPDAAERVIPAVADTIRRLARDADRVARIGNGRFAVLLSETDEIAAINYIERVRRACELWLESGAIALHLIVGWAGTTGDPTLSEAYRIAMDRMHADRRRGARRFGFEGSATA